MRLRSLFLVLALLGAAGCADSSAALEGSTPGKEIKPLADDLLPGELLGLKVTREDVAPAVTGAQRSYMDAVGLYSMRREDLVQATLQVSRFNPKADDEDPGFRSALVNQIGGSRPQPIEVGDDTVYLIAGTKQTLSVFFRDNYLLVLAVRDDFDRPRTLLREVLNMEFD